MRKTRYECMTCYDSQEIMTERGRTDCPDCAYVMIAAEKVIEKIPEPNVVLLRTGLRLVTN